MKSEKIYAELLLIKAQNGDLSARDNLLALLSEKVKAFVFKILGGSTWADDCVQESLLKIFQRIKQIKEVKAMHTWVYRVVHSTCMDYLRKNSSQTALDFEPGEDLSGLEQQIDVKSAIAALPKEQQVIIYLFYYEGFNVADVAGILAKPPGTVKYLLFTARDRIKGKLS